MGGVEWTQVPEILTSSCTAAASVPGPSCTNPTSCCLEAARQDPVAELLLAKPRPLFRGVISSVRNHQADVLEAGPLPSQGFPAHDGSWISTKRLSEATTQFLCPGLPVSGEDRVNS